MNRTQFEKDRDRACAHDPAIRDGKTDRETVSGEDDKRVTTATSKRVLRYLSCTAFRQFLVLSTLDLLNDFDSFIKSEREADEPPNQDGPMVFGGDTIPDLRERVVELAATCEQHRIKNEALRAEMIRPGVLRRGEDA